MGWRACRGNAGPHAREEPPLGEAPALPRGPREQAPGGPGGAAQLTRMRRAGAKQEPGGDEDSPRPCKQPRGPPGPLSLPEKRGGQSPAAPCLQGWPSAPSQQWASPALRPCLELFVVPAPAEVAARGPAPQEGLQRVHRRPLAPRPPSPMLAALLLLLALLMLAFLLYCLFFLLGARRSVSGGGGATRPEPAQDPESGPPTPTPALEAVYLSAFLFLLLFLLLLLGERPALLICTRARACVSSPAGLPHGCGVAQASADPPTTVPGAAPPSPQLQPPSLCPGSGQPPPALVTKVTCRQPGTLSAGETLYPQDKPGQVRPLPFWGPRDCGTCPR